METLVFKVVAAPILIGGASLASWRWGQQIGGWLVALPLTAGPVVFFLAVERGAQFASTAAAGCLAGAIAQGAFCVGYTWASQRFSWPQALLAGGFSFAALAAVLRQLHLGLIPLFLIAIAAVAATLCLIPRVKTSGRGFTRARWDIWFRMAVATAAILVLTASATAIGPTLSGILAAFPIYASTLTGFAHHSEGRDAAMQVLRGLQYGLFAYAVFFLALSLLLLRTSLVGAFFLAGMIALTVQGCSLWILRNEGHAEPGRHGQTEFKG